MVKTTFEAIQMFLSAAYCSCVGHNTDGKYFVTNSKLGFSCETRPRRVMVFIEKTRDGVVSAVTDVEVRDVVCGQNHVVSRQHLLLSCIILFHFKGLNICIPPGGTIACWTNDREIPVSLATMVA